MDLTKKTCSICQNGARTARRMTGTRSTPGVPERTVPGGAWAVLRDRGREQRVKNRLKMKKTDFRY